VNKKNFSQWISVCWWCCKKFFRKKMRKSFVVE